VKSKLIANDLPGLERMEAIDSPQQHLRRLVDGYVMTQLLYVATKLGVAQALADGPRTGAEVAEAVGADPAALTRVLRGLALEDVVSEEDGRFALTPVGECLPAITGALTMCGQVYYHGAEGLLAAVREGGASFERVYGVPFFTHLETHAEDGATFHASMAVDLSKRRALSFGPTTSARSTGWSTSVAGVVCCLRPSCVPRRAFMAFLSTALPLSQQRERICGSSEGGPNAILATSSQSCRQAVTPTCSRASCMTGTMSMHCVSSPFAARR
jgi:hypothetical protein